ncbi:MAG: tRNA-intron lyase [Candidatus Micrarchaeota archaeon]
MGNMGLELEVDAKMKKVLARDASTVGSLAAGHFGIMKRGVLGLEAWEALYLIDMRNAKCTDSTGRAYAFGDLALMHSKGLGLSKYFAYAAWRNRGLIARGASEAAGSHSNMPVVKYPSGKFEKFDFGYLGRFFFNDLMCLVEDEFAGRSIYEKGWFGQFGVYKADKRGGACKLDAYEALFLQKFGGLEIENATFAQIRAAGRKARDDFDKLYFAYEDWRKNGYVLKTGFKFGTHFRIYFPGATPSSGEKWAHSEHVLHVFERKREMLISEWARAIRVAHSVRKSFVLAIEGQKKKGGKAGRKTSLDFLLYHRKGDKIAKPGADEPKYLMMALYEEERLSGERLAKGIEECKALGLGLILAIVDRETAVTFYEVKRIDIPGSDFEYYELEWVQP